VRKRDVHPFVFSFWHWALGDAMLRRRSRRCGRAAAEMKTQGAMPATAIVKLAPDSGMLRRPYRRCRRPSPCLVAPCAEAVESAE